jgi:hypothetical protein
MAKEGVPTEEVIGMKKEGADKGDIIGKLEKEGYSETSISNAIGQADLKERVEGGGVTGEELEAPSPGMKPSIMSKGGGALPSTPAMTAAPISMPTPTPVIGGGKESMEIIEELTESIVKEKWDELMKDVGNIALWKDKMQTDIRSLKQELLRVEQRFENLQKGVVGKIGEYGKGMVEVTSEIKALEKVMQKITEPLAENIKELNKITKELKGKSEK